MYTYEYGYINDTFLYHYEYSHQLLFDRQRVFPMNFMAITPPDPPRSTESLQRFHVVSGQLQLLSRPGADAVQQLVFLLWKSGWTIGIVDSYNICNTIIFIYNNIYIYYNIYHYVYNIYTPTHTHVYIHIISICRSLSTKTKMHPAMCVDQRVISPCDVAIFLAWILSLVG